MEFACGARHPQELMPAIATSESTLTTTAALPLKGRANVSLLVQAHMQSHCLPIHKRAAVGKHSSQSECNLTVFLTSALLQTATHSQQANGLTSVGGAGVLGPVAMLLRLQMPSISCSSRLAEGRLAGSRDLHAQQQAHKMMWSTTAQLSRPRSSMHRDLMCLDSTNAVSTLANLSSLQPHGAQATCSIICHDGRSAMVGAAHRHCSTGRFISPRASTRDTLLSVLSQGRRPGVLSTALASSMDKPLYQRFDVSISYAMTPTACSTAMGCLFYGGQGQSTLSKCKLLVRFAASKCCF